MTEAPKVSMNSRCLIASLKHIVAAQTCTRKALVMSALGHKRTIALQKSHVRFTPESGHSSAG